MRPLDYTEAFDLTQRLDSESEHYFNEMRIFADRIAKEDIGALEDAVGGLQESIDNAKKDIQKRIMAVYAIIAREDVE